MATFSADVYQNEFLPDGGTDVHAIVTVTCSGAGEAGRPGRGDAAEIVIVDTSGSMSGDEHRGGAGRRIGRPGPGRSTGCGSRSSPAATRRSWPTRRTGARPWCRWTRRPAPRPRPPSAGFRADGGTAMGTWLALATRLFAAVPSATQRHAILLTDGYNQHETPEQLSAAIEAARGQFQCDCRGVGSAWQVAEVRRIATALLGSVDLIAAARARWRPTSSRSCASRWAAGSPAPAAGVGAAGVPGAVRPPGRRRRSRTSRRGARRSTR